jgi:hypothetical protein
MVIIVIAIAMIGLERYIPTEKEQLLPEVVVHACNASIRKAETGEFRV